LTRSLAPLGALSAAAITVPHAIGVGIVAFAALLPLMPIGTLVLWSTALPGAMMTLALRTRGVIYAPSTTVAVLYGGMLSIIVKEGALYGITGLQAVAMASACMAVAFVMQWAIGWAGIANLARFLPLSVMRGFSAGVGLSLLVGQLVSGLGSGSWAPSPSLAWHAAVAAAVIALSLVLQRVWPRFPSLLVALAAVSIPLWWLAPAGVLRFLEVSPQFALPPLADWSGAPWWPVLERSGLSLMLLALLVAIVNGLEVLVFHQQLENQHGIRRSPDEVLRKESVWGALTALFGLLPASTSTSRSQTALQYTLEPSTRVGPWHSLLMLGVAMTGHLWLSAVALAGLAGALIVAGARMVPAEMRRYAATPAQRQGFWQSWAVAVLFVLSDGMMALVAGLIISTVVLLRSSAAHAIRRMHLHGQLRSRHVRGQAAVQTLAAQMHRVAAFELQGIVSFGVAALVVDQVLNNLKGHDWVILDVSRVPAWDETGYSRMRMLAKDLAQRGVHLLVCGLHGPHREALQDLKGFVDLDRALEHAEDCILAASCAQDTPATTPDSILGELGEDIPLLSRLELERRLQRRAYAPGETIIRSGDEDRTLMWVAQGSVTLSTADPPEQGIRLAVIGQGMVFGEMAFLNGIARTAYAHAGPRGADILSISWADYKAWSHESPQGALGFMKELARMGIRRLGSTSQELRAALQ
jgi:sulfate permease, SulP family